MNSGYTDPCPLDQNSEERGYSHESPCHLKYGEK